MLIDLKCPSCGGALQCSSAEDIVKCNFCGTSVMVRESIILKSFLNVNDFEREAENSFLEERYLDCNYFSRRMLEENPNNPVAWLYKGISEIDNIINDNEFDEDQAYSVMSSLKKFSELNSQKKIKVSEEIINAVLNEISTSISQMTGIREGLNTNEEWNNFYNFTDKIIKILEFIYIGTESFKVLEYFVNYLEETISNFSCDTGRNDSQAIPSNIIDGDVVEEKYEKYTAMYNDLRESHFWKEINEGKQLTTEELYDIYKDNPSDYNKVIGIYKEKFPELYNSAVKNSVDEINSRILTSKDKTYWYEIIVIIFAAIIFLFLLWRMKN